MVLLACGRKKLCAPPKSAAKLARSADTRRKACAQHRNNCAHHHSAAHDTSLLLGNHGRRAHSFAAVLAQLKHGDDLPAEAAEDPPPKAREST